MPVLNTEQEVIAVLGGVVNADDPIAELEKQGFTLGGAAKKAWDGARANVARLPVRPAPGPIKQLGTVTFSSGKPKPFAAPALAPGDYEVLAGVRTSVGDEALKALYASGTIPHVVALDQVLDAGTLANLEAQFKVDKPGGKLSRLLITGPPTMAAIAENSPLVAVHVPIRLNFDKVTLLAGIQRRTTVTFATGTLRLTMQLTTNVFPHPATRASQMTIAVVLPKSVATPDTSPRLDIDANSPVQRAVQIPPNQVDLLAQIIQNGVNAQLGDALQWSVSPVITLPIGRLAINAMDVRTSGDVLVAGVRTSPGAGDPTKLTNLMPDAVSNMYVQMRDQLVQELLDAALASGQLTAQAKQADRSAVVDSASGRFEDGAMVANMSGRFVDLCPLNVDLAFHSKVTVKFKLLGDKIEVDQSQDNSILDSSNLWCLLTTLGLAVLAAVAGFVTGGFWAALFEFGELGILSLFMTQSGQFVLDQVFNGGGGGGPTFIDLNSAIPGTDRLPTISNGVFQMKTGAMLVAAQVSTRADNVNTYLYARFLVPDGFTTFQSKPLVGARVALMDQDVPAPAGDDASTKAPPGTGSIHGNILTSTTFQYVPPTSDSKLAEAKTDSNGQVRFALTPAQLVTTAGQIQKTTTREDERTGRETTTITRFSVSERKPDLYFRVTLPDGTTVDTRKMAGGFMVNVAALTAGSLENPVTFNLGGGSVVAANA